MPTYTIDAPDGKTYSIDGPAGATQEQVVAQIQAAKTTTAQPSFMDKVAASPMGRAVHDVGVQGVEGLAHVAADMPMFGSGVFNRTVIDPATKYLEGKYSDALARNRNTPGYASARTSEEVSLQRRGGSGFDDQVLSPIMPALAGVAGLVSGQSLDSANAAADAQTTGMDAYRARHPRLAAGANVLGLGLAGPEGMADSAAAFRAPPLLLQTKRALPMPAPTAKAMDYVGGLMRSAGKSPADLAEAAASTTGRPITSAEAIGNNAQTHLAALARRDGATPDALEAMLSGRTADAPGRVLQDYAHASGIDPSAAQGDIQSLVADGRQKAAPLYDIAHAQPPVITDRLQQFAQEPIVQQGMKHGIKIERLKSLAEGKPFDPNAYAVTHFDEAGDPVIGAVPTWKTWDAAKLGLDTQLDQYRNPVTGKVQLDKMGSAINDVRKSLLNEVDAVNPAYKAARAQAGDYLSSQAAFDRGGKMILDGNTTVAKFTQHLQDLTPAEQQALNGGIANKLFNLAQNGQLTPKVFNRPIVRLKLEAALGPEAAQTFLENVHQEAMAKAANRMVPGAGSPTQELRSAMDEQDNAGLIQGGISAAKSAGHAMTGNVGGAIRHGINAASHFLPDLRRVGGMSQSVRNEAGRMLIMPPGDLAALFQDHGTQPASPVFQRPALTPQSPIPYNLLSSGVLNQGSGQ
jgi:hypothetical protein